MGLFCGWARALFRPFMSFTYAGAGTYFMTAPAEGGGEWDRMALVPGVIEAFYKAMPDGELALTNLLVVVFVFTCIVAPPLSSACLAIADARDTGRLGVPPAAARRARRAARHLAPWTGTTPLAVGTLFVSLELERMVEWLLAKTAHRLGVAVGPRVFRISGDVNGLFWWWFAYGVFHDALQVRALWRLRGDDRDARRPPIPGDHHQRPSRSLQIA